MEFRIERAQLVAQFFADWRGRIGRRPLNCFDQSPATFVDVSKGSPKLRVTARHVRSQAKPVAKFGEGVTNVGIERLDGRGTDARRGHSLPLVIEVFDGLFYWDEDGFG